MECAECSSPVELWAGHLQWGGGKSQPALVPQFSCPHQVFDWAPSVVFTQLNTRWQQLFNTNYFQLWPKSYSNPTVIEVTEIELVENCKYLGSVFDNRLCFWAVDASSKKVQQCVYFLRKMNSFNVYTKMITLFCGTFIDSALPCCIVVRFVNQIWLNLT